MCPYGTLEDIIRLSENGRMSEEVAKLYAGEIICFLSLAHGPIQVFHGRLNPMNCQVYQNRHIKIQNFKNSKFFGANEAMNVGRYTRLKLHGDIEHELPYFPPEFIESEKASPSMDFWGLGCIIYQMITGRIPFKGKTT